MKITVNGDLEQLATESLSIAGLLEMKKVESPEMVSVQLNGRFIDRTEYPVTILRENDALEFLYFMGGGAA